MSFFSRRRPAPAANQFQVPPGVRVYAIGDVHGCARELDQLLGAIDVDHAGRSVADRQLVFVGDLIDRGPDSAAVVRRVHALCASGGARLLMGNHEELLLLATSGDRQAARMFTEVGGIATLTSYGIGEEEALRGSFADLAVLMKERLPAADLAFLARGEEQIAIGDYLFVHAGIRPGVPLDQQQAKDLRWIRREFLESRSNHGMMVVHGHTITDEVDVRSNRIGIDTGAFASGRLTALALEGGERWLLDTAAGGAKA